MLNYLFPVHIEAEHLDDAWWQAIRNCFKYGHEYLVTHGSYEGQRRFEFDMIDILIKRPGEVIVPIMPEASNTRSLRHRKNRSKLIWQNIY